MMMSKLVTIAWLDDRFMLILLSFIKIGMIRTNDSNFNGISVVFGLFNIELQINLSKIKKKQIYSHEYGRA
jgi:hypothetical protein